MAYNRYLGGFGQPGARPGAPPYDIPPGGPITDMGPGRGLAPPVGGGLVNRYLGGFGRPGGGGFGSGHFVPPDVNPNAPPLREPPRPGLGPPVAGAVNRYLGGFGQPGGGYGAPGAGTSGGLASTNPPAPNFSQHRRYLGGGSGTGGSGLPPRQGDGPPSGTIPRMGTGPDIDATPMPGSWMEVIGSVPGQVLSSPALRQNLGPPGTGTGPYLTPVSGPGSPGWQPGLHGSGRFAGAPNVPGEASGRYLGGFNRMTTPIDPRTGQKAVGAANILASMVAGGWRPPGQPDYNFTFEQAEAMRQAAFAALKDAPPDPFADPEWEAWLRGGMQGPGPDPRGPDLAPFGESWDWEGNKVPYGDPRGGFNYGGGGGSWPAGPDFGGSASEADEKAYYDWLRAQGLLGWNE